MTYYKEFYVVFATSKFHQCSPKYLRYFEPFKLKTLPIRLQARLTMKTIVIGLSCLRGPDLDMVSTSLLLFRKYIFKLITNINPKYTCLLIQTKIPVCLR